MRKQTEFGEKRDWLRKRLLKGKRLKKKDNSIKLGDALKELMDQYKLNVKITEVKICNAWDKVLGQTIANHTVSKQMIDGKLLVKLDSAALRNELAYAKSKIIDSLNKEVGVDAVKELMLM